MKMRVEQHEGRAMVASWQSEIEKAIDNVKRDRLDKWMRAEWHKAKARDHWSERRKAKWVEWRSKSAHEVTADDMCPLTSQRKVWVRGRVPKEFLDWVERYWSHDDVTRAMLNECCFEVWER
ncbi:hypothetical protein ACFL09_03930 [Planctomycetota bacterium]